MALKLFYTFEENDATTIRDYSGNSKDGVGSNITIQNNAVIGKEAVFNSTTDSIAITDTGLGGISKFTVAFRFTPQSTTGTLIVFNSVGNISVTWDGTTLEAIFTNESADSATVSTTLTNGTEYHIVISLGLASSNDLRLYKNSAQVDQDSPTVSGSTAGGAAGYIGNDTSTNSANFYLSEFKIFTNEALTVNQIKALYNNNNGITVANSVPHNYNVGDIIGNTETLVYAAVTYVDSNNLQFKLQPLSGSLSLGMQLHKVGHLWDTTADHYLHLTEDGVYMYDSVNSVAEVLNADNLVWSLDVGGIKTTYTTKTANYTATNTDNIIFCDTSAGSFTITLPASPDDKKELTIIDDAQTFNSYPLTINPNGNTITGQSTNLVLNAAKTSLTLFYKGSGSNQEWKIK